jgi:hypothetical protein
MKLNMRQFDLTLRQLIMGLVEGSGLIRLAYTAR